MSEKYYKVLKSNNKATHSDFDYTPFLPLGKKSGKWLPKVENIKECKMGYHITRYWNIWYEKGYKIFEVEFKGVAQNLYRWGVEDKIVCKTIRLVKDVTEELIPEIDVKNNTGYWNTGNRNTGNCNTGYWNTGDRNTGNCNTGDRNTGDCNTGDCNTGYCNTGDWNTGNRNTGDCNTGDRNTGNCNTGKWNTGNWNTGNCNTGFLNTTTPKVRMFNKETDVSWDDLRFPDWLYVKKLTCECFKNSFENAKVEDVRKTLDLPNFNYAIFEEITGISKADFDKKLKKVKK